jgi:hypothetical protein
MKPMFYKLGQIPASCVLAAAIVMAFFWPARLARMTARSKFKR